MSIESSDQAEVKPGWYRFVASTIALLVGAVLSGCANQEPVPSLLPSCGTLERGQHINEACLKEARRALADPTASELDQWRAKAALDCPVKGVIPLSNDDISFECIYDLQKVGELGPRPWWLRPLVPVLDGINWALNKIFRAISPLLTAKQGPG